MKLYAPEYYKKFKCIADKCKHSCCIGWEIDIDEDTLKKYESLKCGYGIKIAESIAMEETPHFSLSSFERCPHLDENGLCRIITQLGEDYLCDICREHPRFYNNTARGIEVGLGMSCEEACRRILSSDGYKNMVEAGETDICGDIEFDALPHRDKVYSIISDRSIRYIERLNTLYREFVVSPALLSDSEWSEVLSSLEYLDEAHKKLFSVYTSKISAESENADLLERALAYFVYRHCTRVSSFNDFRAALGMCLVLERLLASLVAGESFCSIDHICELARIISEEIEYSEDNTDSIKIEFTVRVIEGEDENE